MEAVQKAKVFCNRCEDLVIAAKKSEHNALLREFNIRQFQHDAIKEGSTCGGRMIKESLVKCRKLC